MQTIQQKKNILYKIRSIKTRENVTTIDEQRQKKKHVLQICGTLHVHTLDIYMYRNMNIERCTCKQ